MTEAGRTDRLDAALAPLFAMAPARLGRSVLICTCPDCIPAEALRRIETTDIRALSLADVGAWFGAAWGFGDDALLGGPETAARLYRAEARFFFVKLLQALAEDVRGAGGFRRGHWYTEPGHWIGRLTETGFHRTFTAAEAAQVAAALRAIAGTAMATGSRSLWDALEYLGTFSDALPAFMDEVDGLRLRDRVAFWGRQFGGRIGTPAGQAGRAWIDFRIAAQLLPPPAVERLAASFTAPEIGAFLARAAERLADPDARARALLAWMFWENSVQAMAFVRPARSEGPRDRPAG